MAKINSISKLWSILGVLILFSLTLVSLFWKQENSFALQKTLAQDLQDSSSHLALAEILLENNQFKEAEIELTLAQSQDKKLWQKKQYENPEDIKSLIKFWEETLKQKPGFRDAFLQLSYLHYKIYKDAEAKKFLQEALEIDPNFKVAKELKKIY